MAKIIKGKFGSEENKDIQEINNIENSDGRKPVYLKLSLTEREESIISNVQKGNLLEELNSFPSIYEGEINIAGVYAFDMGKFWEVKAFLRNGTNGPVNFENVALVITNSKKEILADQFFHMQDVGDIPPYSARPYKLKFYKTSIHVKKIPSDDWIIAFDRRKTTTAHYENFEFEGLQEELSKENISILNRFLRELPKVEQGKIDIAKFSIGIGADGKIMISMVARNGFHLPLTIGKLPVTVKNEEGNVIFSAIFDLQNVKINPEKARLLTLTGDTGIHPDKDMDLSNCTIEFRI